MFSLLENFTDLPDDLISADLRIGNSLLNNSDSGNNLINSNSTPQQVSSNTTPPQQQQPQQQQQQNVQTSNAPQLIQQGSPVPNNTLNQRPPLSSPQPPSSISTSGDPTPTMPCVSSTPTHNVASSAGHNIQRTPLQMMSMPSSVSPNQQQMANHSVPNSHFTSSSMSGSPGSPHPAMGHMGGPQHMVSQMQQRMRPTSHGGMTGPLRVGMPHQPHAMMAPNMSQHHGGMVRSGMGMGGMVGHQNVAHRMGGMGQVQMAGGPQYIHQHQPGHHAMHGHQMVNAGMPNQPQMGSQNMMGGHMMPGAPLHMRSNMIHHGDPSHMAGMHGPNPRFGNPRPGGEVPNMMQDDSQLLGGGGMAGMNSLQNMSQPRPQGGVMRPNEGPSGMGGPNAARLPPQPHNDIGGRAGFGGMNPAQQQQQQQAVMTSSGQTVSTGGTTNSMPGSFIIPYVHSSSHGLACCLWVPVMS